MAAPHPPSTVVLQTHGDKQMRFDVGKAALQLRTAMQAAPLWVADLWLMAAITLACSLAAAVLAAYAVATVESGAWPIASMQMFFVAVAVGWMLAAAWRARRALQIVLYGTVACVVLAIGALMLWLSVFQGVHDDVPWLWWALAGVQGLQTMAMLGAMMALANLMACRLHADMHFTLHKMFTDRAAAQQHRGDAGDGVHEPRVDAGSHALHEAAGKKHS